MPDCNAGIILKKLFTDTPESGESTGSLDETYGPQVKTGGFLRFRAPRGG
jgi:hypothetical protein